MDLRLLRNFLAICDHGSISRAARELDLGQPALTRQVALLEAEVGARILDRSTRGVTPTEAGLLLRDRGRRLVDEVDVLAAEIRSRDGEPRGSVGLGLPVSLVDAFCAPLVETYAADHPGVLLRVYQGLSNELESLLSAGTVDVAIVMERRKAMPNVRMEELASEPLFLVGPPDGGLDPDVPVDPDVLPDLPLIAYGLPNDLHLRLNARAARRGRTLRMVAEIHTSRMMLNMVRSGSGYAVMPRSATEGFERIADLSLAPLGDMAVVWTLAVSSSRPYSAAIKALEARSRTVVGDRVAAGVWARRPMAHWIT